MTHIHNRSVHTYYTVHTTNLANGGVAYTASITSNSVSTSVIGAAVQSLYKWLHA